jgi:hypothetical protein
MSISAKQAFTDAVGSFLLNTIFTAVSNGLAQRGVAISAADLAAMAEVPITAAPFAAPIPAPAMNYGGAVVPAAKSTAKPTARGGKAARASVEPGETYVAGECCKKYVRGDNAGKFCRLPVKEGSVYCSTCHRTEANKKTKSAPPAAGRATTPGIPGGIAPSPFAPVAQPAAQSTELQVEEYDASRNLYRDTVRGLLILQSDAGLAAIGRVDQAGAIVAMSDDDITFARTLGLTVDTKPAVAAAPAPAPAAIPAPIAAPVIPAIAAIPAIPAPIGIPVIPQPSSAQAAPAGTPVIPAIPAPVIAPVIAPIVAPIAAQPEAAAIPIIPSIPAPVAVPSV